MAAKRRSLSYTPYSSGDSLGLGPSKCNVKQDTALSETSSISNIDRNVGRHNTLDRTDM
jgi:hypothetical protein